MAPVEVGVAELFGLELVLPCDGLASAAVGGARPAPPRPRPGNDIAGLHHEVTAHALLELEVDAIEKGAIVGADVPELPQSAGTAFSPADDGSTHVGSLKGSIQQPGVVCHLACYRIHRCA